MGFSGPICNSKKNAISFPVPKVNKKEPALSTCVSPGLMFPWQQLSTGMLSPQGPVMSLLPEMVCSGEVAKAAGLTDPASEAPFR